MLNREEGVESGSGCRIGKWMQNRGVGVESGSESGC